MWIGVEDIYSDSLDIELHWHKDDTENTEEGETDAEEADPLPVKHGYNGDGRVPTYVQVNFMDLMFLIFSFPTLSTPIPIQMAEQHPVMITPSTRQHFRMNYSARWGNRGEEDKMQRNITSNDNYRFAPVSGVQVYYTLLGL